MDRSELQRLQMLYREMDDLGFATALHHGPEAYIEPAVWTVITEEAARRGIVVPNKNERDAYWKAIDAEVAAAEPPPLPLRWRVYARIFGTFLVITGIKSCGGIVGSLVENPNGWLGDLKWNAAILACVLVGFVLLRLQIELQWARLSRTPEK